MLVAGLDRGPRVRWWLAIQVLRMMPWFFEPGVFQASSRLPWRTPLPEFGRQHCPAASGHKRSVHRTFALKQTSRTAGCQRLHVLRDFTEYQLVRALPEPLLASLPTVELLESELGDVPRDEQ